MSSGTITTPPPIPNSPEKKPATLPTTPSFAVRARSMRGILGAVSAALTLAEALEAVRADPSRSAILLDVDGTLAPIVRHADDAHVPEVTRTQLIAVSRRYALVACVSGRRAATARRMVSIGSIAYVGNHGAEILPPGGTVPDVDPDFARAGERVHTFRDEVLDGELHRLRVRAEDKDQIAAFHWRGAPRPGGGGARRRRRPRQRGGTSPAAPRRRSWSCTGGARCSRCARRWRSTRAAACGACCATPSSTPRCTSATTPPTSTPSAGFARWPRRAA